MSTSTAIHDLKTLILSFHPIIAIETVEEERVADLLRFVADDLRLTMFDWTVTQGLVRPPEEQPLHGTAEPLGMVKYVDNLTVDGIYHLKDFAPHLSNAAVARKFREVAQSFAHTVSTFVLTGPKIDVPGELNHKVVHYELQLPTPKELRRAVLPVIESLQASRRTTVDLRPGELNDLVNALTGMTVNQARQAVAYAALVDGRLGAEDAGNIVERKAQLIRDGGVLEFYPVQDNHFELGGFQKLRAWLDRARMGFSPEAEMLNLTPPRGILLVGVQGCGKSLAAKVIAREWKLPLLKLDAGRLYDKYVGESEKNFRKAVALAESMAPAVLWIDEIEKAMVSTGSGDQDGGLSRRLFGAFLTWLQEKKKPVFVVATANDLSHTPPELLRKGRFDEIFFVDLPDADERRTIFTIHLGLRKQRAEEYDLDRLVAASEGFSGAEIEQAVIAALYAALHQRQRLDTELICRELQETVPLSRSRREDIQRLREMAKDRFVSVR